MGLGFHVEGLHREYSDMPHWSYSGFSAFRIQVATSVGILNLQRWWDCGSPRCQEGEDVEALRPLLDHSDCDGALTPSECAQVAPVLRRVVSKWESDAYDTVHGMRFVSLMEECAAKNLTIEFC